MADAVSDIKSRLQIEDLVAGYVQLKKSGRNFKALCPFHPERTPSFHVSVEKQLAYCFGCHKGGDIFKFIEEIEGLDFKGALAFLADKAGVEVQKYRTSVSSGALPPGAAAKESRDRKTNRDALIAVHEEATNFFEHELWNSDDGNKILKYLRKRDLSEETIRAFRLGFAPDSNAVLFTHLLQKEFSKNEILEAGLALARGTENSSATADRFRMRLMFPIANLAGSICAFGGRAVREGDEPKYLNSPETPIFHKSSSLYALSASRQEIRLKDFAVVVEGYMDAIAAHQAGFKNIVACGGTSLTTEQLSTIRRFTKNVVFSFDRDEAGINATERSIEIAFDQDLSVKVAVWKSKAKDPDECIRNDPKLFQEAVVNGASAQNYLLSAVAEKYDTKDVQAKRAALEVLLPFFARVKRPMELDEWLKEAGAVLNISAQSMYDELKRFQGKQKRPAGFGSAAKSVEEHLESGRASTDKEAQVYEYLLGLLLTYKELISVANQIILPDDFPDIELQNIYRILTTQYNQQGAEISRFNESEQKRVDLLGMYIEDRHADATWEAIQSEAVETIRSIIKRRFDIQKKRILGDIKKSAGGKKLELLEFYQEILSKESQSIYNTAFLWQKR